MPIRPNKPNKPIRLIILTHQVGDLIIILKPRASAWGSQIKDSVASERRFMIKSC